MSKIKLKIKKDEIKVRKSWGSLNPSTRVQKNSKKYNRQKFKDKRSWDF